MGAQELVGQVERLARSKVGDRVRARMEEFRSLGRKGNREWFSEMCFCILTANSRAKLGIEIQNRIGQDGFMFLSRAEMRRKLKEAGHRYPNTRSKFIAEARKFSNIKDIISEIGDPRSRREWLVKNVKGLGLKEASHFLRNVGMDDFAILDRHVLNMICEFGIIDAVPSTLTKKRYLEIEGVLQAIAKQLCLKPGELDLYLWYMKTGEILK